MKKEIGYRAIHDWLQSRFGKPDKCENPECNGVSKTFGWSLIKGKKYDRKRENYWMLCRSCHASYDFTEESREKMKKAHKGKHYSPNTEFKKGSLPWNTGKRYKIIKD